MNTRSVSAGGMHRAAAILPSEGVFYLEQPKADYSATINPGRQTNYAMRFLGIKDE